MTERTIDDLVADLRPVRRTSPRVGMIVTLGGTLAAIVATALVTGLRYDIVMLQPAELVLVRSGLLLLIGLAAMATVVGSARPEIGGRRDGWRWTLLAGALLPLASATTMLRTGTMPVNEIAGPDVIVCFAVSLASALLIGGGLIAWLRRGAVTDAARAGWLVGLAAGALGTFAYNLHCPSNSVHFAAIWYTLAVAVSAGIGRLVGPQLLRW
ncbi:MULTISPECIES: DUF1109 domain-containing protein [unclassified Sphingomonas]|uniref:DUF1109 domain-containing protein n=1 Tax=unclassified Sphingomonas TaxID=196159 RepID=UPI00082C5195|nr:MULTISPECIES: DUF1109 domain-containing protein [unclassified Sphingomonas]